MAKHIAKPAEGEYAPYAPAYINLVPNDGLVLQQLTENFNTVKNLILSLPPEKLLYRYADGKWTIKEVLVHIMDSERIFSYRALCIARHETLDLPGFEENDYARYSNANNRDIKNILDDYEALRHATITLFNGFDDSVLTQTGTANKNKFSVRAAAYMIAGHELHHLNIIKERYL
jgi:hypothetical protein